MKHKIFSLILISAALYKNSNAMNEYTKSYIPEECLELLDVQENLSIDDISRYRIIKQEMNRYEIKLKPETLLEISKLFNKIRFTSLSHKIRQIITLINDHSKTYGCINHNIAINLAKKTLDIV